MQAPSSSLVLCRISLPLCVSSSLCQNSASIVGGAALPFHEVSGATGSGKDKINHFIYRTQGEGAIDQEMGVMGGAARELEGRKRELRGEMRKEKVIENCYGGSLG